MKFTFLEKALEEYDAALEYYIERNELTARTFAAEFEFGVDAIVKNLSDGEKKMNQRESIVCRTFRTL